jgi:branched-chain amino acid transport system permease protein
MGTKRGALIIYAMLAVGCIFLPFFLPENLVFSLTLLFMYVALAISWNFLGGYTGLLSFGHSAFFGLGAYTASALILYARVPFPLAIVISGIAAALFAAAVGYPFIRLKGAYFAIGMMGLAEILLVYFKNEDLWMKSSGGTMLPILFRDMKVYYFSVLAVLIVTAVSIHRLIYSRLGLGLLAVREDLDAAEMSGVGTNKCLMIAYVVSAFFPGVLGALFVANLGYFEASNVFNIDISESMVVMSVLGGIGTFSGPIIGAAIIYILSEVLRSLFLFANLIVYSVTLILVCLCMPGGIMGAVQGRVPLRNPFKELVRMRLAPRKRLTKG